MAERGITIEFQIENDESGGYIAHSQVGTHSLVTQGEDLDELREMIEDLLGLYSQNSGEQVAGYLLHFSRTPVAA